MRLFIYRDSFNMLDLTVGSNLNFKKLCLSIKPRNNQFLLYIFIIKLIFIAIQYL